MVSRIALVACSIVLTAGCATLATAQAPGSAPPNSTAPDSKALPFDPKQTIPEKIEPNNRELAQTPGGRPGVQPACEPRKDGEALSKELGKSGGVICPPVTDAPSMNVQPPVAEPNTTPVIPPPGSPGNPSPVIPK